MPAQELQIWDLWIQDVGATGISFARGRLDATDVIIVHAAPEKLNVEVGDQEGNVLAQGENLPRTTNSPMARLRRQEHLIQSYPLLIPIQSEAISFRASITSSF